MSEDDELFREILIDHGQNPRHEGLLGTFNRIERGTNSETGDRVVLTVRVEDGRIGALGLNVEGSTVLRASASLMAESVTGLPVEEAAARARAFIARLTGPAEEADWDGWGDVAALSGIQKFPARVRCAALPWRVLAALLDGTK